MTDQNIFLKKSKPWQMRWWREKPDRWRWAATAAVVLMLISAFAFENPDLWQNQPPGQVAEQLPQADPSMPEPSLPDPPLITAEQEEPEEPTAPVSSPLDSQPGEQPDAVDNPGAAQVVSAAPEFWQPPALGVWSRGHGFVYDSTFADYRFHSGADLPLAAGSPVFSTAAGTVQEVYEDSRWGGVVLISHGGGWQSSYMCISAEVTPGQEVIAGETIGRVLESVAAEAGEGSHLHFEMELNGIAQDPLSWITAVE